MCLMKDYKKENDIDFEQNLCGPRGEGGGSNSLLTVASVQCARTVAKCVRTIFEGTTDYCNLC